MHIYIYVDMYAEAAALLADALTCVCKMCMQVGYDIRICVYEYCDYCLNYVNNCACVRMCACICLLYVQFLCAVSFPYPIPKIVKLSLLLVLWRLAAAMDRKRRLNKKNMPLRLPITHSYV